MSTNVDAWRVNLRPRVVDAVRFAACRISAGLCFCAAMVSAHGQDLPNIVLIVAEDLSLRVGAFGDVVAQTPNIDALALSLIHI